MKSLMPNRRFYKTDGEFVESWSRFVDGEEPLPPTVEDIAATKIYDFFQRYMEPLIQPNNTVPHDGPFTYRLVNGLTRPSNSVLINQDHSPTEWCRQVVQEVLCDGMPPDEFEHAVLSYAKKYTRRRVRFKALGLTWHKDIAGYQYIDNQHRNTAIRAHWPEGLTLGGFDMCSDSGQGFLIAPYLEYMRPGARYNSRSVSLPPLYQFFDTMTQFPGGIVEYIAAALVAVCHPGDPSTSHALKMAAKGLYPPKQLTNCFRPLPE